MHTGVRVAAESTAAPTTRAPAPVVGDARDPLEHEADRLADRLMAGGSNIAAAVSPDPPPNIRRCGGEPCDCTGTAPTIPTGYGESLSDSDRAFFEPAFGADLSTVRLHRGHDADESARSVGARAFTVGARAFTVGSDIVLSRGEDRRLLAHELVHVLQQRAGGGTIRRQSVTPGTDADRREMAREGVRFLRGLADNLGALRDSARVSLGAHPTPADADRVLERFNQDTIQRYLARGKSIYEAQHGIQQANDPVVGELRATYTDFLHTVRAAADYALDIARGARRATLLQQEPRYGDTVLQWLEATGFRTPLLTGRTTFTPAEAAASATYEQDITALLGQFPYINLANAGAADRVVAACDAATTRITPNPTGGPTAQPLEPALATRIRVTRDTAAGVRDTIADARRRLDDSATALRAWVGDQAASPAAGAALQRFFRTSDTGYGTLLADRLALMSRQLGGAGSLYLHMPQPQQGGGVGACDVPTVHGESPHPYEIVLCRAPNAANQNHHTLVLLHELAHAVVPGHGSRQGADEAGRPLDRAYAGERLIELASTEESLANAESYAEIVFTLTGGAAAVRGVPTDTVERCTPAQADTVREAVAWAQTMHRRSISYIGDWQLGFRNTGAYNAEARDRVTAVFGAVDDRRIDAIFADMTLIQQDATNWSIGHTFTCQPAGGANCPTGAVGAVSGWIIEADRVRSRRVPRSGPVRVVCPAFFTLGQAERRRAAFALVVLRSSPTAHPEDALRYARLGADIWDIPAPVAASLADHTRP